MPIHGLIADWPEAACLLDDGLPWRPVVASWPPPWRLSWGLKCAALQEAGMPWREAEEAAYAEMLKLRANPRPLAGRMVGGGAIQKDPTPMPRMPGKRITKKDRRVARETGGGLFDESDEVGRSTTYQMEPK